MPRKRFEAEEILQKLREAEVFFIRERMALKPVVGSS